MVAPRGFEPRPTDPKSAVLPLDEGAAHGSIRDGLASARGQRNGAEDGTRTRDPHLGKVMLYQLSHFRSGPRNAGIVGAESQSRTGDTAIFSRVLYQLSYLGPAVAIGPERLDGEAEDSTGPFWPSIEPAIDGPAEERLEPLDGDVAALAARARRGAPGGPDAIRTDEPSSHRRQPPTPSPSRTMMWARMTWATRAGGGSAGSIASVRSRNATSSSS